MSISYTLNPCFDEVPRADLPAGRYEEAHLKLTQSLEIKERLHGHETTMVSSESACSQSSQLTWCDLRQFTSQLQHWLIGHIMCEFLWLWTTLQHIGKHQ